MDKKSQKLKRRIPRSRMLNSLCAKILLVSSLLLPAAQSAVQVVDLQQVNTFSVTGFDDNDNVQIITQVAFPNSCYQMAPPIVKRDLVKKVISIQTVATLERNAACLSRVSYHPVVVDLGRVPQGTYQIKSIFNGQERIVRELNVDKAGAADQDSFMYAPIEEVQVIPAKDGSAAVAVTVKGTFSNNCMELKELRVPKQIHRDVTVILPISDFVAKPNCKMVPTPFSATKTIQPGAIGFNLVHVRSENGYSLNKVFTVGAPQ